MPQLFGLFLLIGTIFGLLAATCAFLIAYMEYQHHFQGWRQPARMALQTAVVAFVVFFVAAFLPWLFLPFTTT